ncbi:alpha-L-rhamnosidase C-terminal domain-containing protein [Nonomuraea salmonea]|uniref:alpha-L-rhamnosidase C-terminal domain-containing protein n=1 Tax=Nonomuraea salmonea TaxID=46181 RepID=UPI0031EA7439
MTEAEAALDTPYGTARVAWTRAGGELTVTVTVPPGATAELDLPIEGGPAEVGAGTHTFTGALQG